MLAIKLRLLLHRVVGQVHHDIGAIFQVEGAGRGANVALLEPVGLETPINASEQEEVADVELPPLVQKGFFNVFL